MSTSQASAASPLIRIPAGRHVEGSHRAMFFRPASSLDTQFATPAPPPRPSLQRQHSGDSGVPPQTPAMAAQFISQNNPAGHRRYLNAAQREASIDNLLEGAGLRRGDPIPASVEGEACYRNLAGGETRCRVTRGGLSEREARRDAARRQRERRRTELGDFLLHRLAIPTPAVEDPVSRRGALAAASAAGVAPPPPPALRRAYTGGRKSRKRRKRRKTRGRRKRRRRSRRRKKRKRRRTRRRRRH